jgi:anti-sigma-K factor RskA
MASSIVSRTVNEPSRLELSGMASVLDVLAWAGLEGDAAMGLLTAIGASIDAKIFEIAGVDPGDFAEAMSEWRISEDGGDDEHRPPTAMEKGRARAFHKACRIKAELEWSQADVENWEWHQQQDVASAAAAHTAAVLAASRAVVQPVVASLAPQVVKVSEVADVTKTVEALLLDDVAVRDAFRQYTLRMWTEPRPEQEPTVDQLSALAHLLKHHCCYVDLSIWGPHGMRILKQMKVSGLILSAGGEFVHHEFKGPPSIEHWTAC